MHRHIGILLLIISAMSVTAQKRFSEGTVIYEVQISKKDKNLQSSSQYTQLIKGSHYRDDLVSRIGKSTSIFDMREGIGAILKEYGGQKILIPLVSEQWDTKLKRLASEKFNITGERKTILGFSCEQAEATDADGTSYTVFFTRDLAAENQQMDLQFPQLGGFALEYTMVKGETTVKYTATALSFDPVPIQRFDIPNAGYRILSFEESRKVDRN